MARLAEKAGEMTECGGNCCFEPLGDEAHQQWRGSRRGNCDQERRAIDDRRYREVAILPVFRRDQNRACARQLADAVIVVSILACREDDENTIEIIVVEMADFDRHVWLLANLVERFVWR